MNTKEAKKERRKNKLKNEEHSVKIIEKPKSEKDDYVKKDKTKFEQTSLRVPENIRLDNEKVQKKLARKLAKDNIPQRVTIDKKVGLFSHLPQYDRNITSITKNLSFSTILNPHIIKLGLQYADHIIRGSNSRCLHLLETLKKFVIEYQSISHKDIQRDLESKLKPNIAFLSQCRPLSINMRNAIKYFKYQIVKLPSSYTEAQVKSHLITIIDDYIMEKIVLAGEAISKTYALTKISQNDLILIYSDSSLIYKILYDCHKAGKNIRVVVVDSRPDLNGYDMMKKLSNHRIQCSYVYINNISHVLPKVNKVILGAHALLANGYVMGRVGASLIAQCAQMFNVPVLLCCETYKFAEKVQTDSFVYNELADPNALVTPSSPLYPSTYYNCNDEYSNLSLTSISLSQKNSAYSWENIENLNLLNMTYDVTPPEFITTVITELGMLPCTSVPVILRVKNVE